MIDESGQWVFSRIALRSRGNLSLGGGDFAGGILFYREEWFWSSGFFENDMTYWYMYDEVGKKYTTAMTSAKNEVCVGWLHGNFYLEGGD